jgi:hypothetical protein
MEALGPAWQRSTRAAAGPAVAERVVEVDPASLLWAAETQDSGARAIGVISSPRLKDNKGPVREPFPFGLAVPATGEDCALFVVGLEFQTGSILWAIALCFSTVVAIGVSAALAGIFLACVTVKHDDRIILMVAERSSPGGYAVAGCSLDTLVKPLIIDEFNHPRVTEML